jgi:thioredoxin reductase
MQVYDIVILGAGVAGLNASFLAARKGLKAVTIESLEEAGGQLTTLYAEKQVYNFPGMTIFKAKNAVEALQNQVKSVGAEIRYNEIAQEISKAGEDYIIKTNKGQYQTQRIILALGKGSFIPRAIGIENEAELSEFVSYLPGQIINEENKDIAILGGGDSAVDWALHMCEKNNISLIHRRTKLRAEELSIKELDENSSINKMIDYSIQSIIKVQEKVEIIMKNNASDDLVVGLYDHVFVNYGFTTKLEIFNNTQLQFERKRQRLIVNGEYETNQSGIYAIGDLAEYSGKIDNILSALNDANHCINNIAKRVLKSSGIY